MAGHSAWKNIQHRKGAQDKRKAKVFTKLLKEITVAVKTGGGGDPDMNPRLRAALINARAENVPKDNIERCVKKAMGVGGESYDEVTFEGHGPDGVCIFIECATDNNTRTVSNIKSYFNKAKGALGKNGCLDFVFQRKSIFIVAEESLKKNKDLDEDTFTLEVIDAGAEDITKEEGKFVITAPLEAFGGIQKKLTELGLEPEESKLQRVANSSKKLSEGNFPAFIRLIESLEDDDDIQNVYHNAEYDEKFLGQL